jgi:hypothetical protein
MQKDGYKAEKLCQTFLPRKKYIVHYRNLQQYVAAGLKITKIHKVLTFKQSTWMKPYVTHNSNMRRAATTASEKDFYIS